MEDINNDLIPDDVITYDYDKIKEELEAILNETNAELFCPKCKSKKITYRVRRTKEMAKAHMTHVGAYCENGHFVKWVKQTPEIISVAKKPVSLF